MNVRSGMIWTALRNLVSRFSGLVVFFVLAKILTPHDFGIFAAAYSLMLFLDIFVDQGLGDALVQRKELDDHLINSVFVFNILLAVVLTVSIWLISPLISSLMNMPELENVVRLCVFSLLINSTYLCQQAIYRRNFRFKELAKRSFIASITSGVLGLVAAYLGFGVYSLVVQFISLSIVNAAYLWINPIWSPVLVFNLKPVATLFKYSFNVFIARILDFVSQRGVDFYLGALLGAAQLGVFSVGVRIYLIFMQLLSSVVLDVSHVAFSKISHDRDLLTEAYLKSIKYSAAFAVPFFLMISVTATSIIDVLFGVKWHQSATVLSLYSILGAIQVLQFYNGAVLNAIGSTNLTLRIVLTKVVAAVVAMLIARDMPLTNLIVVFVFFQALSAPISFYYGLSLLGLSVFKVFNEIKSFLFAASFSAGCTYFFVAYFKAAISNMFDSGLLLSVSCFLISYLLCLVVVFRPDFMFIYSNFKIRSKVR